jgi:hypothetical protein
LIYLLIKSFKSSIYQNFFNSPKEMLIVCLFFFSLHIQGMQNLSISCSLVCLIILGSAALVGAFGICQRQVSAVLVTGVMYLLAGKDHHPLKKH